MAPKDDTESVRLKLRELHDHPVNTEGVVEADLILLFTFLMQHNTPQDGPVHWFCSKADPLVVEAATFLLRLHAYSSPRIQVWRSILQRCLSDCAHCVQKLQEIKTTSRHTCVVPIAHVFVLSNDCDGLLLDTLGPSQMR